MTNPIRPLNWPFPPNGNPVPWTPQQIAEYAHQQRAATPEALL